MDKSTSTRPAGKGLDERTHVVLVDVPAHQALTVLAAAAADDLGTGTWDGERAYDGELEGPVNVTTATVFGERGSATTMAGGTVLILVDEDHSSLMQLRKVVDELLANCCTTSTIR